MPQYEDLLKDTSKPWPDDNNYFELTITDLNISTLYPLQFRWKYKDGSYGIWSVVKSITTAAESFPNVPSTLTVANNTPGYLQITWDGKTSTGTNLTNFDRVDIYINGAPFDSSKPAASFFSAGTQTITAPAGVYIVSSYAVSKVGTLSAMSVPVTRTVIDIGVPVQTPTLPNGITVATAPFAVTVNWPGTYSSQTFTGFKSIDIYAVGSDLGSTTTSGINSTNLVGSFTVNDTPNKINISLDNLRQALGLSNNSDVYSSSIYYYYISKNSNNTLYSVSSNPTYTRINSSSVIPTKANFIDLVSGVISIENLVAGNGNFASWLRTGTAGGTRIELSAVSDFINNGYTVQKGLVAYSSGNTELFNLDLDAGSLTINGSGTFTGDLSAGSGSSIFKSDSNGIYLGDPTFGSAPFSVSRNGVLKANSGTIGGWTLGSTYLQGNNFEINSSNSTIYVGPTGGSHIRISASGGIATYNGGSPTSTFSLSTSGSLSLSGSVSASSGSIGGWTINSSTLTGGSTTLNSNGTLTVNSLIANTGGTIGGWTINNGYLSSSDTFFYPSSGSSTYSLISTRDIGARKFFATSTDLDSISTSGGLSVTGNYQTANGYIATTNGYFFTSNGYFNANSKTTLYADGRIYADNLGISSGTPNIRQDSNGYLRYTSSSSERYKNSIVDINSVNSLDPYLLLNIPVRAFKYNEGYIATSDQRYNKLIPGFIAEEVEKVYPIAVDYIDEKPETWVANYMIPGMLAIIKDLKQRLDALEN